MTEYHKSVLLQEVIENLHITAGENYIDGTLGGGGHTFEILKRGGKVLGIDVDQEAIDYVEAKFKDQNSKVKIGGKLLLVKGNFRNIDTLAGDKGFTNVSGVLFDLGVSSHQFDTAERGFSFQKESQLDMRMDPTLAVTAGDLVNGLTKDELAQLFFRYGEERFSHQIAKAIVDKRKEKQIETTGELADVIRSVVKHKSPGVHPATRVFQALRIAVNDELHVLEEVLPKAMGLLKIGGRIAVISFHSLEDRIVKQAFLAFEKKGLGRVITDKPIMPTEEEIRVNPRSRSAKLRVFEKTV